MKSNWLKKFWFCSLPHCFLMSLRRIPNCSISLTSTNWKFPKAKKVSKERCRASQNRACGPRAVEFPGQMILVKHAGFWALTQIYDIRVIQNRAQAPSSQPSIARWLIFFTPRVETCWYGGQDLGSNRYEHFGKIQNMSEPQFPHQ